MCSWVTNNPKKDISRFSGNTGFPLIATSKLAIMATSSSAKISTSGRAKLQALSPQTEAMHVCVFSFKNGCADLAESLCHFGRA